MLEITAKRYFTVGATEGVIENDVLQHQSTFAARRRPRPRRRHLPSDQFYCFHSLLFDSVANSVKAPVEVVTRPLDHSCLHFSLLIVAPDHTLPQLDQSDELLPSLGANLERQAAEYPWRLSSRQDV